MASKGVFILASFSLLALVSFLYSTATSPIEIILTRVVEGISWALLWPVLQAVVTTDTLGDPKKALSYYNITWSAGATMGPLAGAILVATFSYRETFELTSAILVLCVIANLISYIAIRRKSARVPKTEKIDVVIPTDDSSDIQVAGPNTSISDKKEIVERPNFVRSNTVLYFVATALVAMNSTVLFTFFPPYAASIRISIITIGIVTFTFGGARFFGYFLTTRDKIRSGIVSTHAETRIRNISLGLGLLALAVATFLFARGNAFVYELGAALVGVLFAAVYATTQAGIIADSPRMKAGTAAGTYECAMGIGSFIGPILSGLISAGTLLDAFFVPLVCDLAVALTFAVIFVIRVRRKGKNQEFSKA